MQQLICTKWLHIEEIQLEESCLDDAALCMLNRANWPKLISFILSSNPFGAQGMASLVKAHLPCLQQIFLEDSHFSTVAIGHLQQSQNQESVCLSCNTLDIPIVQANCIAAFGKAQWPGLRHLDLQGTWGAVPALAVTDLIKAHWPLLQTLNLSNGLLPSHTLAELSQGF